MKTVTEKTVSFAVAKNNPLSLELKISIPVPFNGPLQMEKDDKGSTMIRMGVSGWMFLLVLAYPGCPGSKAVKRSLLLLYLVLCRLCKVHKPHHNLTLTTVFGASPKNDFLWTSFWKWQCIPDIRLHSKYTKDMVNKTVKFTGTATDFKLPESRNFGIPKNLISSWFVFWKLCSLTKWYSFENRNI